MKKVLFLIALFTLIGGVNSVKATSDVVDMNVNINIDNETRNYQLYVPANVDENCPLVISLHGANGASTNYTPFTREVASAKGCIVAYPQGKQTNFPIGFGGYTTGWTATGEDNFDVKFLKAVIEDVASKYPVDRKRIYCCGFSNGGMMTYAMANACSDEIAAFASISGYPINEFHLRHTSSRPVPFMHIHGTADNFVLYEKMPTIVDEMVARLGANPVPIKTTVSGKYTKSVYEAGQGGFPYVYYEVDGMGHEAYTTKTEDGNSALTMWNFFKEYTLDSPSDETLKWAPRIETADFVPTAHGFTMNDGTTLLSFGGAQYTEANKNVYSSLQFESGKYKLCFKSTGASGKTIGVTIEELASPKTVVLSTTVHAGEDAELPFEVSDGWGEYRLTMTRPEAGDNISVTDIVIKTGEAEDGTKTPLLLLKNGAINTTDFDITPIAPSTLTTDNLYAATFTSKANTKNAFQYLDLDVSGYDKAVIKYSILDDNEWRVNTNTNHYALPKGTDQTYEIDLSGVDTYNDFTVFSSYQNHTVGSSITISEVYLLKSPSVEFESVEFEFDAFGKGTVDKSKLTATGGLTYNPSTGALSSNGKEGSLVLVFATPVDMRNLFQFNLPNSGQTGDILSRLEFYDEDNALINTWNSIKLGNTWSATGIDDNATKAFLNHKPVKRMVWPSDANAENKGKTATITSVDFTCKTIACAKAGETVLKSLPWIEISSGSAKTPDWNMNGSSDTYYGNYSGDPTHYANLKGYSELRVYCKDNNTGFRCFFINAAGTAVNQIHTSAASWNAEKKYYSLDLSTIEEWNGKVALKAMKAENGGGPGERFVTNIVVYKAPAANAPQYTLTGSGMQLAETVAALADANATCIDATGVTGITTNSEAGRTLLTSANPNCLFLGTTGNGGLANTQNVVTSGTCANLVLTDGYPFMAPADFTATTATYTTTINAEAGAGTLCLPFAATIPQNVTAWTLTYTSGDEATATEVTNTIAANTPVLLNGSGEVTFSGSSAAVTANASNTAGALTGVYESTAVPTDSYVLQNGDRGLGFYKVSADDPITLNPFRAYLTAAAQSRSLRIVYGGTTGISLNEQQAAESKVVYDLQGRRVAQPTKGLYIVNGKKVIK